MVMSLKSLPCFDLTDGVYIVTGMLQKYSSDCFALLNKYPKGGGRGLGLTLATAVAEAGGKGKLERHVLNCHYSLTLH